MNVKNSYVIKIGTGKGTCTFVVERKLFKLNYFAKFIPKVYVEEKFRENFIYKYSKKIILTNHDKILMD